ncbi:MAG: hypothetical protein JSS49_04315 [Planctomycetes bacterium]|nr:hypothetical protein [Planctomycetota bacterium]
MIGKTEPLGFLDLLAERIRGQSIKDETVLAVADLLFNVANKLMPKRFKASGERVP